MRDNNDPSFSYAKLALLSLSSATMVLVVVGLVVMWIAPTSKVFALLAGVAGVVLTIAVMGFVASRTTDRLLAEMDETNAPGKDTK